MVEHPQGDSEEITSIKCFIQSYIITRELLYYKQKTINNINAYEGQNRCKMDREVQIIDFSEMSKFFVIYANWTNYLSEHQQFVLLVCS